MTDFTWRAHPALRVALALAVGILVARVGPYVLGCIAGSGRSDASLTGDTLIPSAAILALAALLLAARLSHPGAISGLVILPVVAASGSLLASLASSAVSPAPAVLSIQRAECIGTITEEPRARFEGLELVVACDSIMVRNTIARVGAKVLVRIDDGMPGMGRAPLRGDRVSIRGLLRAPRAAGLPHAFDESDYLRSREIVMVLDVDRRSQLHIIDRESSATLHRWVSWVRGLMSRFAHDEVGGTEGEVVEALLSGDRDGIDRDTKAAFAATGTLHVLAVSGLHVAVIALGLSVVTSWVPDRRAQFLVFALVLGAYAVVTGGSPSIVRAWFMAVCFALARLVGRRAYSLNVLACAAAVLLLVRPDDLFDIGFQLSFAAVAGIILLNRRIVDAVHARWPTLRERSWADFALRSIAITISAQILSLPLQLMHFGSAPVLGLLLNLPVVPLTSCAMAAAAVGVLASPIASLSSSMGATSFVATRLSVAIVEWGATLPYASIATVPLAPSLALAALIGLSWASFAKRMRAVIVRVTVVACGIAIASIAADRVNPLSGPARPRAYIVPAGTGVIVATFDGDTLIAAVPSVTPSMQRHVAALERIVGASHTTVVVVNTPADAEQTGIDARPPLIGDSLFALPVVVDRSSAPARCASLGGVAVLVAGMRMRCDRLQVFEYNGGWYPIEWH